MRVYSTELADVLSFGGRRYKIAAAPTDFGPSLWGLDDYAHYWRLDRLQLQLVSTEPGFRLAKYGFAESFTGSIYVVDGTPESEPRGAKERYVWIAEAYECLELEFRDGRLERVLDRSHQIKGAPPRLPEWVSGDRRHNNATRFLSGHPLIHALPDEKPRTQMQSENPMVRLDAALRRDWTPRATDLILGMMDCEPNVRAAWSRLAMGSDVVESVARTQIEAYCKDPSPIVRLYWARNGAFTPSSELAAAGLSDTDPAVRSAWIERRDVQWTVDQQECGLSDPCADIRAAWASRTEIPVTRDQVSRGLHDPAPSVRGAWAQRFDWKPTSKDIERGLGDQDPCIRTLWLRRLDWTISDSQVVEILNSHDPSATAALLERRDWLPTDAQVEEGLAGAFASSWIAYGAFVPTDAQVLRGLNDPDEFVRARWALRGDWIPKAEQIEAGLTDESSLVRVTWVERSDYQATSTQRKRGCNDVDSEVAAAWHRRDLDL